MLMSQEAYYFWFTLHFQSATWWWLFALFVNILMFVLFKWLLFYLLVLFNLLLIFFVVSFLILSNLILFIFVSSPATISLFRFISSNYLCFLLFVVYFLVCCLIFSFSLSCCFSSSFCLNCFLLFDWIYLLLFSLNGLFSHLFFVSLLSLNHHFIRSFLKTIPRYCVIVQKWLRIALLWRSNTFLQLCRRGGGWPSSISCGNVVTILWQTDCRVVAQSAAESETPFLAAGWLRFFEPSEKVRDWSVQRGSGAEMKRGREGARRRGGRVGGKRSRCRICRSLALSHTERARAGLTDGPGTGTETPGTGVRTGGGWAGECVSPAQGACQTDECEEGDSDERLCGGPDEDDVSSFGDISLSEDAFLSSLFFCLSFSFPLKITKSAQVWR